MSRRRKKRQKIPKDYTITVILIFMILSIFTFKLGIATLAVPENTDNIVYDKSTNTLHFNSLTLRQKIAQTIITFGVEKTAEEFNSMFIGGFHLGARASKYDYINGINEFKESAVVPPFFTVDQEGGCMNPFEEFKEFRSFREIDTPEEAYELGKEIGSYIKELGFTTNFAPVVDLEDHVWECRNFLGTPEEIAEKAESYIKGLQESGVMATSKHYPGRAMMTSDPHKFLVYSTVTEDDLIPFRKSMENKVLGVMVSHVIVDGSLDSENKPSCISEKLVNGLKEQYAGLIITDEVRMRGLRGFYDDEDQMYIDLYKAGNDIILYFDPTPEKVRHIIDVVEKAVREGIVSEENIDQSVLKILEVKGINVIR